jgi:hypothetical protein
LIAKSAQPSSEAGRLLELDYHGLYPIRYSGSRARGPRADANVGTTSCWAGSACAAASLWRDPNQTSASALRASARVPKKAYSTDVPVHLVRSPKRIEWVGSSRADLRHLPEAPRRVLGFAL